MKPKGSI